MHTLHAESLSATSCLVFIGSRDPATEKSKSNFFCLQGVAGICSSQRKHFP